jgi:hypothetical protein
MAPGSRISQHQQQVARMSACDMREQQEQQPGYRCAHAGYLLLDAVTVVRV